MRTPCSDLRRETSGTEGSNPPPSSAESCANLQPTSFCGGTAASVGSGAATDSAVDALLARASAKLDETGEEDRTEIIDLIEAIRDARSSGDSAALEDVRSQLQDLLFYLET